MNKNELYKKSLNEIHSVWDDDIHITGNLANICAILKTNFGFWWVGFYQKRQSELQLGAFQGPVACTRIPRGKGVCGKAWNERKTIIVPNVHEFEGHIACNSESNAEIVVPIMLVDNEVWGVLDIDSRDFDCFDIVDKQYLEEIASFISEKIILEIPY
ncbi:MAG: GAF domain-containing protein [Bacteroidetes bacterium]|nr:GAF domain-containing protein [Bacteroidota bacterium]